MLLLEQVLVRSRAPPSPRVMSTSLKVVSSAAVFLRLLEAAGDRSGAGASCARAPRGARRTRGAAERRGRGERAAARAAGAGRPAACRALAAASTSSLVRRPSLPVPLDRRRIETDARAPRGAPAGRGSARALSSSPAGSAVRGQACGSGAARRRRRRSPGPGGVARRAAARLPRSSRCTAPTSTVSPTFTMLVAHHARDGRRHVDGDLVGFQAGDRLVGA